MLVMATGHRLPVLPVLALLGTDCIATPSTNNIRGNDKNASNTFSFPYHPSRHAGMNREVMEGVGVCALCESHVVCVGAPPHPLGFCL